VQRKIQRQPPTPPGRLPPMPGGRDPPPLYHRDNGGRRGTAAAESGDRDDVDACDRHKREQKLLNTH